MTRVEKALAEQTFDFSIFQRVGEVIDEQQRVLVIRGERFSLAENSLEQFRRQIVVHAPMFRPWVFGIALAVTFLTQVSCVRTKKRGRLVRAGNAESRRTPVLQDVPHIGRYRLVALVFV